MADKIVLVDFAGTLVKAEIIEEANKLRSDILEKALPSREEHGDPEKLYKVNRAFVEKLTGLKADFKLRYRENDLDFIELTGEQFQNQISTNLFQIGMYMTAKKYGKDIFPKGFVEQLQRIKKSGYKLATVSGVRTDIISGMLQIAGLNPELFDYLYGQPPILGMENQEQDIKELRQKGNVEWSIADKYSDLERTKAEGTKLVFVKWGHVHPEGGEEELADYTIEQTEELKKLIF